MKNSQSQIGSNLASQALKATVPPPILKQCLDDMALDNSDTQFYDSDEEDDAPKKAKKSSEASGDCAGSLVLKAGRNANSSLYYVDHTKQKNDGNGLEPDQRNALASDLAKAQEEESILKAKLESMTKETAQLLSEPTNEEATATLEQQESEMNDIRDKLEEARKLKCNEKIKKALKKRIRKLCCSVAQAQAPPDGFSHHDGRVDRRHDLSKEVPCWRRTDRH